MHLEEERPRLLMRLEATYKSFQTLQSQTEACLRRAADHPELVDLYSKLKETDRQLRELFIGQADKSAPVNVTGESVQITDILNDPDSSVAQVRRVQAKRLAKRLYSLHHPDKGGSPAMFNTVRQAAVSGDLETLLFFRIRDGVDTFSKKEVLLLIQKIEVKSTKFRGSQSFRLGQAYFASRGDFVQLYKKMLQDKILQMQMQMFGCNVQEKVS